MHHKITGFCISTQPIDTTDIDLFQVGLTIHQFRDRQWYVYLWGIGDVTQCRLPNGVWTMSFPQHTLLTDRNVLITPTTEGYTIENDWLGSIPVFYNTTTHTISTNFNLTLPAESIELHPEGLNNYLDYGYSVFEQTPVRTVQFMRYSSLLTLTTLNLQLTYQPDPVWPLLQQPAVPTTPEAVLQLFKDYIHQGEVVASGPIIIPTSGGFDSRLLNCLVSDKSRIRAFTYGIADQQADSFEVVKARVVTKTLGVAWQQVPLGEYNRFAKDWYALYGAAVHLHGTYHIELYRQIASQVARPATVLSGIIGDAWSGKFDIPEVKSVADLKYIGYTHGLEFSSEYSRLVSDQQLKQRFFEEHQEQLQHPYYRLISAMRFKLTLLSYLMSLPDAFGYASWTPQLSLPIVMAMLRLPEVERTNRQWQQDFFRSQGVLVEDQTLQFDKYNSLTLQSLARYPLAAVSAELLEPYIQQTVLSDLNQRYQRLLRNPLRPPLRNVLLGKRYIGEVLRRLGVQRVDRSQPYNQLIVLKSLELLLQRSR